jgi:monoamine oxidase
VTTWRDAARALPLGRVVKVLVRLRHPVWPETMTFVHDPGAPIPTWWTVPSAQPLLVGWAGGAVADALVDATRGDGAAIVRRAASSLARTLGHAPRAVRALVDGAIVADWGRDPLASGAYSWVPVGNLDAQRALATPIEDTLYYAGEAADFEGASGTVHGAIRSGTRAAEALLARISVNRESASAEQADLRE